MMLMAISHTHTHTHRADNLAKLRSGKEFDVLVIGGGVTGVGVALDSQLRGGLVPQCYAIYTTIVKQYYTCR